MSTEQNGIEVVFVVVFLDPRDVPRDIQTHERKLRHTHYTAEPKITNKDTTALLSELEKQGFYLSHFLNATTAPSRNTVALTFHFFKKNYKKPKQATIDLFTRLTSGFHRIMIFERSGTLALSLKKQPDDAE
jgi:hypothetical protein